MIGKAFVSTANICRSVVKKYTIAKSTYVLIGLTLPPFRIQDKMVTPRVQEKLCENEARVKVLTEQWAEKWKEAHNILEVRRVRF